MKSSFFLCDNNYIFFPCVCVPKLFNSKKVQTQKNHHLVFPITLFLLNLFMHFYFTKYPAQLRSDQDFTLIVQANVRSICVVLPRSFVVSIEFLHERNQHLMQERCKWGTNSLLYLNKANWSNKAQIIRFPGFGFFFESLVSSAEQSEDKTVIIVIEICHQYNGNRIINRWIEIYLHF